MMDRSLQRHYLQQPQVQGSSCEEVDSSRSSGEAKRPNPDVEPKAKAGGESTAIEVAKRPRGRPPGSKNKPKLPIVIMRETEPSAAMRPHVLEISSGHDVADSLAVFSRRRNVGFCVLSGTGAVANVSLRQPHGGMAAAPGMVTLRGRFEILSVSATFLPPAMAELSSAAGGESISISLAGPQGRVVGGTVAGPLVAAETVALVVAAFANPTFHRLPAEDDEPVSVPFSGSMHERDQHTHTQQPNQGPAADSTGLFTYGSHSLSESGWSLVHRNLLPHSDA